MEHGSTKDLSSSTFSFKDEDHSLANALRFTLNQELDLLLPFSANFCFSFMQNSETFMQFPLNKNLPENVLFYSLNPVKCE